MPLLSGDLILYYLEDGTQKLGCKQNNIKKTCYETTKNMAIINSIIIIVACRPVAE
jgi:hypothetical protein